LGNALLVQEAFHAPNIFAKASGILRTTDKTNTILANPFAWNQELKTAFKYYSCDYLTGKPISRRNIGVNKYLCRYWKDNAQSVGELLANLDDTNITAIAKVSDSIYVLTDAGIFCVQANGLDSFFSQESVNMLPISAQEARLYTTLAASKDTTTQDLYLATKHLNGNFVVHKITKENTLVSSLEIPYQVADLAMDHKGHLAIVDNTSKEIWWTNIQSLFNNNFYHPPSSINSQEQNTQLVIMHLLNYIDSYSDKISYYFQNIESILGEVTTSLFNQEKFLEKQSPSTDEQNNFNTTQQNLLHKEIILCQQIDVLDATLQACEGCLCKIAMLETADLELKNRLFKTMEKNTNIYAKRKTLLTYIDNIEQRYHKTCKGLQLKLQSATAKNTPIFNALLSTLTEYTTFIGQQIFTHYSKIHSWESKLTNRKKKIAEFLTTTPTEFLTHQNTGIENILADIKTQLGKKEVFIAEHLKKKSVYADIISILKTLFTTMLDKVNQPTTNLLTKCIFLTTKTFDTDTASFNTDIAADEILKQILHTLRQYEIFLASCQDVSKFLEKQRVDELTTEQQNVQKNRKLLLDQLPDISNMLQTNKHSTLLELEKLLDKPINDFITTAPSLMKVFKALNECLDSWNRVRTSPSPTQDQEAFTQQYNLTKKFAEAISALVIQLKQLDHMLQQKEVTAVSFIESFVTKLGFLVSIYFELVNTITTTPMSAPGSMQTPQAKSKTELIKTTLPKINNELAECHKNCLEQLSNLEKNLTALLNNVYLTPQTNGAFKEKSGHGQEKITPLEIIALQGTLAMTKQQLTQELKKNLTNICSEANRQHTTINNKTTMPNESASPQEKLETLEAGKERDRQNNLKAIKEYKELLANLQAQQQKTPATTLKALQTTKEALLFSLQNIINDYERLLVDNADNASQNAIRESKLQQKIIHSTRSLRILQQRLTSPDDKILKTLQTKDSFFKAELQSLLTKSEAMTEMLQTKTTELVQLKQELTTTWNNPPALPIESLLLLLNQKQQYYFSYLSHLKHILGKLGNITENLGLHGKEPKTDLMATLRQNQASLKVLQTATQAEFSSLSAQIATLVKNLTNLHDQSLQKITGFTDQITALTEVIKQNLSENSIAMANLKNNPAALTLLLGKLGQDEKVIIQNLVAGTTPFSNDMYNYYAITTTIFIKLELDDLLAKSTHILRKLCIGLELSTKEQTPNLGLDEDFLLKTSDAFLEIERILQSYQLLQNLNFISNATKLTPLQAYNTQVSSEEKTLVTKTFDNLNTLLSREEPNLFLQELWMTTKPKLTAACVALFKDKNKPTPDDLIQTKLDKVSTITNKSNPLLIDINELKNSVTKGLKDLSNTVNEDLPTTTNYLKLKLRLLQYQKQAEARTKQTLLALLTKYDNKTQTDRDSVLAHTPKQTVQSTLITTPVITANVNIFIDDKLFDNPHSPVLLGELRDAGTSTS
jgi:hypothetical protein